MHTCHSRLALGLAALAVAPLAARAQAPASAAPATPATPARVTPQQFAQLRWIVGDWRGSGTAGTRQAPFYERYRLANDSTLLVESFADSTWRRLTETTRFELRGGRLGNAGTGPQWTATAIDSLGVSFGPVARVRNTFRWERAAGTGRRPSAWRATITPAGGAGSRYYLMERVK
jgi:hypothetical protein